MAEEGGKSQESGYRLVLTGDGISVDRVLDTSTALAVMELALGGADARAAAGPPQRRPTKSKQKSKVSGKKGSSQGGRRSNSSPRIVRDLSLRPNGKPSFVEFAAEKEPRNHFEKQTVAVYWLSKILGMQEGVTVDHINTCYVGAKWKRPAKFEGNLQLTAARKGWIDTSDGSNIRITVPGEDLVVHDLPASAGS